MLSRKCVWLYLTRMDLLYQEQFFEPNYGESSDSEQEKMRKEPPKKRRRFLIRRCNVLKASLHSTTRETVFFNYIKM